MTILTLDGKVPWSAMIYYDDGRCGYIGTCSASDTADQANSDARQWLRNQKPGQSDWYLQPSCRITVGYRNVIDGSQR